MRKRRDNSPELFSDLGVAPDAQSSSDGASWMGQISSPAIEKSKLFLVNRKRELGSVLTSDRAVEYVAILRAFADFRARHEPEPLHEDLMLAVCGDESDAFSQTAFKSDLRQLKEWGLVSERIEKERLRGYRDTRRTKFRYRMCEDAVAFVEWLSDMHERDLNPQGGDVTGNLLDVQRSLVAELRRMLHRVNPDSVSYEDASDILFRVDRVASNLDSTVQALQELNLRLIGFAACEFDADEAKDIVSELGMFLERFGRRFAALRGEVFGDIEDLLRESNASRWSACITRLAEETAKFKHIAHIRIPESEKILRGASLFYSTDGTLVDLMSRVGDSARKVWGKLNAKLRELERRNHRLEDLGARLKEFARLGENDVPHVWMRRLLECAAMRGDLAIRPGGEKSLSPKPKLSSAMSGKKMVCWITPRKVGEKADVASIAQKRGERLREWLMAKEAYPSNMSARLSSGSFSDYFDAANIMQVIEYTRLGEGERGRRFLNVEATDLKSQAIVTVDRGELTFDDLELKYMDPNVVVPEERDPVTQPV